MHTDYYSLLGVSRSSTADEIRAAYRRLAQRLHPDVSSEPAAEERFKQVTRAYNVLRDPESRVRYELEAIERELEVRERELDSTPPSRVPPAFQAEGDATGAAARPPEWEHELVEPTPARAGRRFLDRFARRRGEAAAEGSAPAAGDDYDVVAEITFEEAVRGGAVTLAFRVPGGDGATRAVERTVEVRVPKLTMAGERLKLRGEGAPGRNGGGSGDLNVEIAYKPHPLFRVRHDHEVWFYLPIAPWEAVLGAIIEMPTLEKPFRVHVPAGATSGQTFRLPGRGLPKATGGRGDLLACLRIVTPDTPTEQERAMYLQLAQASRFNPRRDFG